MKRKIDVELSDKGIKELQKGLKDYDKWLKAKTDELAKRLADMGAVKASLEFSRAIYTGPEDHEISITKKDNGYIVRATGETVLYPATQEISAHTEYISNALKKATWQSFGLHIGFKYAF